MSLPSFALVALALFVVASGSATAASLLTSKNIKDESIQNRDLRDGAFTLSKLRQSTKDVLNADTELTLLRLAALEKKAGIPGPAGAPGAAGAAGAAGAKGADGAKGKDGADGDSTVTGAGVGAAAGSGNWGIINRNVFGSPTATLRSGPVASFGQTVGVNPPFGKGSLNLNVSKVPSGESSSSFDKRERISYGNEVDYQGKDLAATLGNTVGFSYFTSKENGPTNLPGLNFEIDPNLSTTASTFSTLVWIPPAATQIGRWSDFVDGANVGEWYLTGTAVENATGCKQSTPCSFTEVMAALADGGDKATLYSAAVIKGRDAAFQGAVDGVKFGSTTVDFEENGVNVTTAP